MSQLDQAIEFAKKNRDRYVSELKEFAAIPSISTLPANKQDMQRAAEWVAGQLRGMGFNNIDVLPTAGHPVVYGERLGFPPPSMQLFAGTISMRAAYRT
jgi:acetylornithine deacetylase/succinyl-diaminopimelate desuccinylase-like protein